MCDDHAFAQLNIQTWEPEGGDAGGNFCRDQDHPERLARAAMGEEGVKDDFGHEIPQELAIKILEHHTVKYREMIVGQIVRQQGGGWERVLQKSSLSKEDWKSIAKVALVETLHRGLYDPEKGPFLRYARSWMEKWVRKTVAEEVYGLSDHHAGKRSQIKQAEEELEEQLGQPPTNEQIAESIGSYEDNPEVVGFLRGFNNDPESLDQSRTNEEGEDDITLKERLPAEDRAERRDQEHKDVLREHLRAALQQVPNRWAREIYRTNHGLSLDGDRDGMEAHNTEELAQLFGRSRDTINTRLTEVDEALRSHRRTELDMIVVDEVGYSAAQIDQLFNRAQADDSSRGQRAAQDLEQALRRIRDRASLQEHLTRLGKRVGALRRDIRLDEDKRRTADTKNERQACNQRLRSHRKERRKLTKSRGLEDFEDDQLEAWATGSSDELPCPLTEKCDGSVQIEENRFRCGSCDREGGLLEWLEAVEGMSEREAVREAVRQQAWLNLPDDHRPPYLEPEPVRVITNPEREQMLRSVR